MTEPRSSAPAAAPAVPRGAATLVVVRDGEAGMEVLLLRRVERSGDLSSGAYVFPGGTLDDRERSQPVCSVQRGDDARPCFSHHAQRLFGTSRIDQRLHQRARPLRPAAQERVPSISERN